MIPDQLIRGDCVVEMANLHAASVDLCFADPPFNTNYDYDTYDDNLPLDEYLRWSTAWMKEVLRVLKPTGSFWLAIGDELVADLTVIAKRLGFYQRNHVVWHYSFGTQQQKKFSRCKTHLLYFTKHKRTFTFNGDAVRVPSARQAYGDKRADPKGRVPSDVWILRAGEDPTAFDPTGDVWDFPRIAGSFRERVGWHPCQMPEQILGRIIRASSNPGDVVLDCFAGSCSTLVTAKKLDRRYIGIELSENYFERGAARLCTVNVGDPLAGGG